MVHDISSPRLLWHAARTCCVELGRWSKSVAQLSSLKPSVTEVVLAKHRRACATMADLYAQHGKLGPLPSWEVRWTRCGNVCVNTLSRVPCRCPTVTVGSWCLKFVKSNPVGEYEEQMLLPSLTLYLLGVSPQVPFGVRSEPLGNTRQTGLHPEPYGV
jgi:hypothetical protein